MAAQHTPGPRRRGSDDLAELLELLQRYVDLDIAADEQQGVTLRRNSGLHRSAVAAIAKAGDAR
jgi:hypothetical protein